MAENIFPNGPFEVELTVYITDGEQTAKVAYGLPRGTWPTTGSIKAAMNKALQEVKKQVPGKPWRLSTKREFFDEFAPGFAMPGKPEFED